MHHVRANSYGSGIGSCPRIIRVSPSTETTALVCSAAIVVKGVNMKQSQISARETRCATNGPCHKYLPKCPTLALP